MIDTQAIIDVAQNATAPAHVVTEGATDWYTHADGVNLVQIDRERHKGAPDRKRGSITVHEHKSLARYVGVHEIVGHTALYADVRARSIVAVINGHGELAENDTPGDEGASAGWGDHRATLTLRHSPEWEAWKSKDGQWLKQAALAEHFQDNYVDITNPDHATMLELAQTFQATNSVDFKSAHRLKDGNTGLRYEETSDAKAGQKGDLEIPDEFTLVLRVFEGLEEVEVQARLRYRIREGELAIGYRLVRPEDHVRTAFDTLLADVEDTTGLTAYRAVAPTALQ